jgi:hypothetical protein
MNTEDLLRDALADKAAEGGTPHYDFDALMAKCARAQRLVAVRRFAVAGTGLVVAAAIGLAFRGPAADGTVGIETARDGRATETTVPDRDEKRERREKDEHSTTTTVKESDEVVPTTVKEHEPEGDEPKPEHETPKEEPGYVPPVTEPKPPVTEPPKETPPTTDAKPTVEFTAFATFGSCGEEIPYDIYYGTANPGAKVRVESEYGSGYVHAGPEEGHWELRVEFPEAPVGETFVVRVSTAQGVRELEFTRTA